MLSLFLQKPTCKICASTKSVHRSVTSKAKRSIDILGSLLGLAIAAAVAVPVAVAMLLDNPGPLLYSQVRCGFKGRRFKIWKFRSMVVGAEKLKHLVVNEAKGHIFKIDIHPGVNARGFLRLTT